MLQVNHRLLPPIVTSKSHQKGLLIRPLLSARTWVILLISPSSFLRACKTFRHNTSLFVQDLQDQNKHTNTVERLRLVLFLSRRSTIVKEAQSI